MWYSKKMKIGIDTFGCMHGRSGLGSYLLSILQNLPDLENVEYELFGPEMDRFTYQFENINYNPLNIPDSIRAERFWHKRRSKKFFKKNNYSAVIYTAATKMLPKKFKIPGIAIVNDLVSNRIKNGDTWLQKSVKKSLSKIDCIIASSQCVKDDLLKAGCKCHHIEVVYSGVDHSLFYPSQSLSLTPEVLEIKPFAIKRPYIIYAAKMENADKKHIELIKAFTLFKQKTSLPHRLVLAGAEGPFSDDVHKAVFSSPNASDIFLTGFFPHESFAELYRNADACIVPCIDDGSGLSVLEALATGVPLACSGKGAFKEVAKDGALYFDSDNVEEIACAIEKIITDTDLRQSLSKKALAISKDFSWEKCAKETIQIIQKLQY